jgi:cystathionine gamma-lyase
MKFATNAVHGGEEIGKISRYGDVVAPIHLASTFARENMDESLLGYEYSRADNPTRHALEEKLASLEDALGALAFSSGTGATTTTAFLLRKGSKVIVSNDLYGGTYRLFSKCLTRFGIEFTYIDLTDEEAVHRSVKNGADMVWIESPTNPQLKVVDIAEVAELAHDHDPESLVVVDNTFASPYFQKPLDLGADLALYSTTKYVSGHSDVLGGALVIEDEEILTEAKFLQKTLGATPSVLDCSLVMRGIKTLPLRMEKHQENALAVANFLEEHKMVEKVLYPGLESHPQHELAKQQMSGFSGMVSFELSPRVDMKQFLESFKLIALAVSLGGVESLIEHPWSMTQSTIPPEERTRAGLSDRLIRLSVGIEAKEDILADLDNALENGVK